MSYNDKKIVEILLEQCKRITSRCPGYQDEMQFLLTEVLRLEREHDIGKINIASKIGDQINVLGMLVHKSQNKPKGRAT